MLFREKGVFDALCGRVGFLSFFLLRLSHEFYCMVVSEPGLWVSFLSLSLCLVQEISAFPTTHVVEDTLLASVCKDVLRKVTAGPSGSCV